MRQVSIAALKPTHGRPPSNPAAANFALTDKNYFVSPEYIEPEYIEDDGHL
jgi:hypothetical protein